MASSSNPDNTGSDDQGMDFKGTEEVFESEPHDDGEEFEEDQCQYPYATVARIGVTKNPSVFVKREWLQKADKGPRRNSAGRSPFSRTRNPFHTLIHNHQLETVPFGELPSACDIDRTHAGCGSSSADNEDGWERVQDDCVSLMAFNSATAPKNT